MDNNIAKKIKSGQTFLNRWNDCNVQISSINWGKSLSVKISSRNTFNDYLIISCSQPKIIATLEKIENTSLNVKYDEISKLFYLYDETERCKIYCNDINFYEYTDGGSYQKSRISKVNEYNNIFTQLDLTIRASQTIDNNLIIKLFDFAKSYDIVCFGVDNMEGILEDIPNQKLKIDYDRENDFYVLTDTANNLKISCKNIHIYNS